MDAMIAGSLVGICRCRFGRPFAQQQLAKVAALSRRCPSSRPGTSASIRRRTEEPGVDRILRRDQAVDVARSMLVALHQPSLREAIRGAAQRLAGTRNAIAKSSRHNCRSRTGQHSQPRFVRECPKHQIERIFGGLGNHSCRHSSRGHCLARKPELHTPVRSLAARARSGLVRRFRSLPRDPEYLRMPMSGIQRKCGTAVHRICLGEYIPVVRKRQSAGIGHDARVRSARARSFHESGQTGNGRPNEKLHRMAAVCGRHSTSAVLLRQRVHFAAVLVLRASGLATADQRP